MSGDGERQVTAEDVQRASVLVVLQKTAAILRNRRHRPVRSGIGRLLNLTTNLDIAIRVLEDEIRATATASAEQIAKEADLW